MRKQAFIFWSNCTADQHHCFCYTDSTSLIFLYPKFHCTGQFLLYLVGNPEEQFSCVATYMIQLKQHGQIIPEFTGPKMVIFDDFVICLNVLFSL